MRSLLLYLMLTVICVSCGVKGPPLPPETETEDVSTSSAKTKTKAK